VQTNVEGYFTKGCGRCTKFRTPACKVHRFPEGLAALRALLLDAGLTETIKWGAPCYTHDGRNVAMLVALVDSFGLSFFEGATLDDADGLLELPGPNSRIGRILRFRSSDAFMARRGAAKRLVAQAVTLARAGTRVARSAEPEPLPDELAAHLAADPALARAFAALTPGRQRSHILHVRGAKQAETRVRRAAQCAPDILAGRGFRER
jgi:uncharacterized protein YdeI (YjbR/CyaY-like superfamily)